MRMEIFDLGLVDYKESWEFQKNLHADIVDRNLKAAMVLCRHYPVITLGRSAKKNNIKVPALRLEQEGIQLFEVDRGGDVTYHGPGQLNAYFLLHLDSFNRDIIRFLNKLEGLVIDILFKFAIRSEKRNALTGVWIGNKKIASIGIAIKKWVTYHGLAVNIAKNDLSGFKYIRPCGMDLEMTSMESTLGRDVSIDEVKEFFKKEIILW